MFDFLVNSIIVYVIAGFIFYTVIMFKHLTSPGRRILYGNKPMWDVFLVGIIVWLPVTIQTLMED